MRVCQQVEAYPGGEITTKLPLLEPIREKGVPEGFAWWPGAPLHAGRERENKPPAAHPETNGGEVRPQESGFYSTPWPTPASSSRSAISRACAGLALTDLDHCTQAQLCRTYRVSVKGSCSHAQVVNQRRAFCFGGTINFLWPTGYRE